MNNISVQYMVDHESSEFFIACHWWQVNKVVGFYSWDTREKALQYAHMALVAIFKVKRKAL